MAVTTVVLLTLFVALFAPGTPDQGDTRNDIGSLVLNRAEEVVIAKREVGVSSKELKLSLLFKLDLFSPKTKQNGDNKFVSIYLLSAFVSLQLRREEGKIKTGSKNSRRKIRYGLHFI